jgi:hypothetical protein
MVGNERPAKVMVGYVKKDGTPKQTENIERYISVGKHLLINGSRVWARRIVDGKMQKNTSGEEMITECHDPKYKGELEWLDWTKDQTKLGAQAIHVRYLPGSSSLDAEYQTKIQKIEIDPQKGTAHIELESGENKFDPKRQALLIQLLKVHAQNRDSKSKNPDPEIKGFMYYELTDDLIDKTKTKKIESSLNAGTIVQSFASSTQKIRNLFEILGKRPEFGETDHLSNDQTIYTTLLQFSQTNPDDLIFLIGEYKKGVSDNFEYAKSFNALDLTKNGHIVLTVGGKKELIWDNAQGKNDDMLVWVLENFADPAVYEKTKHFKALIQKLK